MINEIATALAKAQAQITSPPRNREVEVKTSKGGTYKFKYATLDAIIDHVRKPLTDNGIWFTQTLANGDGKYRLVTTLTHTSGQTITSETPLLLQDAGNQAFGSALTYMRRYSLTALLGIAADEDDDANAADGNTITASNDRTPTVKRGTKASSTVMGDGGPTPVGLTADNKPAWGNWCSAVAARLDDCTDVDQVNALFDMHAAGITNLRIANKKWADELEKRFDVRRANIAQKPAA